MSDSIDQIGKFKTVEKMVNLNADGKRMWFEELSDVNDGKMIESMPLLLSFFNAKYVWNDSFGRYISSSTKDWRINKT